jgi:predicted nucleic acid-binding protein
LQAFLAHQKRLSGTAKTALIPLAIEGHHLIQPVTLEPPTENDFEVAGTFCHNAASRLRAGDALHLAVALRLKARYIVTLDGVLLENALAHGLSDGLLLS